jgi:peptide/nickel transport system permease protein
LFKLFDLNYTLLSKILKNKASALALFFILILCFVTLAGALLRPDQSENANQMFLNLSRKEPGFELDFLKTPKPIASQSEQGVFALLFNGGVEPNFTLTPILKYYFENNNLYVVEYSKKQDSKPIKISFANGQNQQQILAQNIVHKKFWLGTDRFGRDLLSRLMAGAYVSLMVGFISVLISVSLGLLLGLVSGYFGSWPDTIISWFMSVVWAIPTLLLVIAISLILGKGFWQIFVAVGLCSWVEVARVVRGQTKIVKTKEYIEVCKAMGFSDTRIILKHILPNVLSPVIVMSASNFANAILMEAGLSFLGLGAQPPMPSWGGMIKEHYGYITMDSAYLAIIPGLAIMLLVLSFILLGNGLRDALDTKIELN